MGVEATSNPDLEGRAYSLEPSTVKPILYESRRVESLLLLKSISNRRTVSNGRRLNLQLRQPRLAIFPSLASNTVAILYRLSPPLRRSPCQSGGGILRPILGLCTSGSWIDNRAPFGRCAFGF